MMMSQLQKLILKSLQTLNLNHLFLMAEKVQIEPRELILLHEKLLVSLLLFQSFEYSVLITISQNFSQSRLALPTSTPSTLFKLIISPMLFESTLPPYTILGNCFDLGYIFFNSSLIKSCASLISFSSAALPEPITHIGSYPITIFDRCFSSTSLNALFN